MRHKVVKRTIPQTIAGVYKVVTDKGRKVYGYGKNLEDATINLTKGLKWDERIKSISREDYKEE
jgi:hypothetical protein